MSIMISVISLGAYLWWKICTILCSSLLGPTNYRQGDSSDNKKLDANLRRISATHRHYQTGFKHAMIYDLVYAQCWLKFKTKWRMSVEKEDSLFTLCFSMSSIQGFG